MRKCLYLFIMVFIFNGCATNAAFVEYRNYDVGRSIEVSLVPPPIKISSHNETQDKYLFQTEDGCQWVYYVNKETKIVESWKYISSPDKCSLGTAWFNVPW